MGPEVGAEVPGPSGTAPETRANRAYWDRTADAYQAEHGAQLRRPLVWGVFSVPEARVRALGEVHDRDVLELGCGAAQWSGFLARRGARPVGLDGSARQLVHARALQDELGVQFPLVLAVGEHVPLRAGRFDLVFCDHGALSYADPDRTLPEVHRLLRPGGRLAFNQFTPFTQACWDEDDERPARALRQPYFGVERWQDVEGFVSFEWGYGQWIRAFRRHGFAVDDLIELRPPARAPSTYVGREEHAWARRWPFEHIWVATRT